MPSPWTQLAEHSVVALTAEASGLGTVMQWAWQSTSPASHLFKHSRAAAWAESVATTLEVVVVEPEASVVVADSVTDWALAVRARTPATRNEVKRILMVIKK